MVQYWLYFTLLSLTIPFLLPFLDNFVSFFYLSIWFLVLGIEHVLGKHSTLPRPCILNMSILMLHSSTLSERTLLWIYDQTLWSAQDLQWGQALGRAALSYLVYFVSVLKLTSSFLRTVISYRGKNVLWISLTKYKKTRYKGSLVSKIKLFLCFLSESYVEKSPSLVWALSSRICFPWEITTYPIRWYKENLLPLGFHVPAFTHSISQCSIKHTIWQMAWSATQYILCRHLQRFQ